MNQDIQTLPLLPVKNTVLFPYVMLPFRVGREASIAAIEAAMSSEEKELIVLSQRDASVEEPGQEDLYLVGTKAIVKRLVRGEGALEVVLQGVTRVQVEWVDFSDGFMRAHWRELPLPEESSPEEEAMHREVVELATKALSLSQPQVPAEVMRMIANSETPLRLVYGLASMFGIELVKEQALLEANSRADALRLIHDYLTHEVQVLELRSNIASKAQTEMSKEQREYLLRQQLRAIQEELGNKNPEQAEAEQLRQRMEQASLPEEVKKEAERELSRMERLPSGAPDYHVIRTYLDYVLDLPWAKESESVVDIPQSRHVLDEDHYGLKEVKERILEHLGVLKMNPKAKAPILCFLGPPGVGKTSLGQSIARALNRKFERLSLGGMHDEAELRGHRRTYIGAMPGRLLQAIRRAGVNNPVLMLDEVDKLGHDFRGDPAAALLEVLDPEQNKNFRDNYLDLPFDLSKTFFVTTANTLDSIPRPLLDRMEILRLPGYTEEEKLEIAKRYQVPRQLHEAGLTAEQCIITDDALRRMISRYTREAGVRQLERTIATVIRKVALRFAEGKTDPVTLHPDDLMEMMGPERHSPEQARNKLPAGVATGLAWTEAGGDVLYVEATLLPDGRGMTITGQLGEVMQESARAAQSYVWSHADELGIDRALFRRYGVHVHVPAGAIPKDGPSAGVTMVAALASLYSKRPARADTAMTGEVTLSGLVLPVGGIKEKMLAARRAGLKRVVIPKENQKDLRDLPEEIRNQMEFVFAETVDDVLTAVVPDMAERFALPRAS